MNEATAGRCADVHGRQVIAGAFHIVQDEVYDAYQIPRLAISPNHRRRRYRPFRFAYRFSANDVLQDQRGNKMQL
jgi:hypothetical protein